MCYQSSADARCCLSLLLWRSQLEGPWSTRDQSVQLKATECQVVGSVGVFAHLDDTEEAISLHSQLPVDVHIDLEGHCTALLLKLAELVLGVGVHHRVLAMGILTIDPSIEDHPGGTGHRGLQIPVLHNVSW